MKPRCGILTSCSLRGPFGAEGIRANNILELETLIPEALAMQAPVVIEAPMGDIPMPRAPQIAPFLFSAVDHAAGGSYFIVVAS